MGRKIRDTLIMAAVAGGCLALTFTVAHGEYSSSTVLYNLIFWAVIVALYAVALVAGLYRMDSLTAGLRHASETIGQMKEEEQADAAHKLQRLMGDPLLDGKFEAFLYDLNHSRSGICDIEDYINEEEADSLIRRRMLELLPDVMTSLGILGTFVGLVWGLRAFEPSNYEAMTASVTSLVDGIKVAFLTSIYGLSLSLVFSYSFKRGYSAMLDGLQSFLNLFHAHVVASSEMESQSRMEQIQREQNEILRSMALDFSDQVAQGFVATITPTLDSINTSLTNMMTTITHNQEVFLQDIVNAFVAEMKRTFHTEYEEFGERLGEMNASMSRNILYTERLYQNLCGEMNSLFAKEEKKMHTAVAELSAIQKKYADTMDALGVRVDGILSGYRKAQDATMKNLSDAEQESSRFWVACNQAMQNYLIEASEAYRKFEKSHESGEKLLTATAAVYQKNETLMQEHSEQLRNLTEIQEGLRKAIAEFGVSQARVNQMLQEFGQLLSGIESASANGRTVQLAYSSQSRAVDTIAKTLQESAARQEEILEQSAARQEELLGEISQALRDSGGGKKRRKFGFLD